MHILNNECVVQCSGAPSHTHTHTHSTSVPSAFCIHPLAFTVSHPPQHTNTQNDSQVNNWQDGTPCGTIREMVFWIVPEPVLENTVCGLFVSDWKLVLSKITQNTKYALINAFRLTIVHSQSHSHTHTHTPYCTRTITNRWHSPLFAFRLNDSAHGSNPLSLSSYLCGCVCVCMRIKSVPHRMLQWANVSISCRLY